MEAERETEAPDTRKEACDHSNEICRLVQENEGLRAKVITASLTKAQKLSDGKGTNCGSTCMKHVI